MEKLAVVELYGAILGAAQAEGARRDDLEDRLGVGLGAADSAQHLSGRRLPGKRIGQLGVPQLQFLEQPDILDRDDSLVGEGLEEGDLILWERPGLHAGDAD